MNRQEIYNKVRKHLLTQMQKALYKDESGEVCAYRGSDGLKCAIGCLIPDELYTPAIERRGVKSVLETIPELNRLLDSPSTMDRQFLRGFQYIHDAFEPCDWERRLDLLANEYDLKVEP